MSDCRHPAYLTYFRSLVALGFATTCISAFRIWMDPADLQWLVLAGLTLVTGRFTLKIARVDSWISVAETFIFTNLILFGTPAGCLTAALDGFVGSLRATPVSRRIEYGLFNMSAMALSAYVAGETFFKLLGHGPLYENPGISPQSILIPAIAMALVHYLCNSLSVAIIVSLESREGIFRIWRENYLWMSISYLTCASVAALVGLNASSITPSALAIMVPILVITYFGYKTYLGKLEEHIAHLEEVNELYLTAVESLALAVDAKDQTTHGHIRRVRAYAMGLAELCGVEDSNELRAIETGALLHDVGKLAIDDYILNKPGRLTKQEFERMKIHAAAGGEILQQIPFPFPVAKYVRSHHERWDGHGYPDGLKGEEIPLGARIIAIADAFDAMRSPRPYKASFSQEDSLELLRSQSGTAYDPQLLDVFMQNIAKLNAMAEETEQQGPELSFRKKLEEVQDATAPPHTPPIPSTAADELAALFELCSSLDTHFYRSDILVLLASRLKRLLPYSTCVFFVSQGDNTLKAAHVSGKFSDVLGSLTIPFGAGVSGWAAAYQLPMLNTAPGLEFQGVDADFSCFNDTLVVPMVSREGCVGTISLYAEFPVFYSQAHLSVLQIVAEQAAPLIAGAPYPAAAPPQKLDTVP
jgi:putative nucleotidyltransferase with HDIG domain